MILILSVSLLINLSYGKFYWSSAGPVPNKPCVRLLETADLAGTWGDNYLCSDEDWGMRWSSAGPIPGMRCTQIIEAAEPGHTTWRDNYLCVPDNSPVQLAWSSAGPTCGLDNVIQIIETADPHTWNDNFLCYSYNHNPADPVDCSNRWGRDPGPETPNYANANYVCHLERRHFRVCEGRTATFTCPAGKRLRVFDFWYGSPPGDSAVPQCPGPNVGTCKNFFGRIYPNNPMPKLQQLCDGKPRCDIPVNNGFMGGDPCPGIYKFAAIAIQCVGEFGAQAEDPMFDVIDGEPNKGGNGELYLSSTTVYGIGMVLVVLLLVSILCMAYHNCYASKSEQEIATYSKVSRVASDEDNELIDQKL